jgi:hypothetical protein
MYDGPPSPSRVSTASESRRTGIVNNRASQRTRCVRGERIPEINALIGRQLSNR